MLSIRGRFWHHQITKAGNCFCEVGEFRTEVGEFRCEVGEFGLEVGENKPEVVVKSSLPSMFSTPYNGEHVSACLHLCRNDRAGQAGEATILSIGKSQAAEDFT